MPSPSSPQADRIKRLIKQFSKFFIVGIANTAIDFAVLNAEMFVTGITSGSSLIFFNIVSFSVAVINSYFMNKYWTFEDKRPDGEKTAVKFSQFIGVSLVGISINSAIVFAFATFVSPIMGLSPQIWVNIGKLLATGISLIWNFVGYKLWVFKR